MGALAHCLLFLFSLFCVSGAALAQRVHPSLGINYQWWQLDKQRVAECPRRPTAVMVEAGAMVQYGKPEVRGAVQRQLGDMRKAGFTSLRSQIVFLPPPNRFNMYPITSQDGNIPDQDQANLRAFVEDIAAAGFETFEPVFGGAGLYCKKVNWGDCFDPASIEKAWTFAEQATRIITAAAGPLKLRFDLTNEGCPAPSMLPSTKDNARLFLTTIATRFQKTFGDNWLISCAYDPGSARLKLLLKDLADAGLKPRFVEVHSYVIGDGFLSMLSSANAMAAAIGADLILGEMRYHSVDQNGLLRRWLAENPKSRLVDALQWPLADPSTKCPFDTPPPYTPGDLETLATPSAQ